MSTSTKTFCVLFVFASVFFFSNATASPPPPSDDILDECDVVLYFGEMIHCLDYLGKGLYIRRQDHPSSSCCSVVRDTWNVYPTCVNVNVLDSFILRYYDVFDRDTTRVAQITSACGIVDGSRKPSARPPVAASPLKARPPVAASPLSLA
ncbi:non-specific lipid-transfer protein-like protein [Tanacetum coccineum]|uniref:Non-specific lipid-transfer protein-like protein n=1 Tax=Tanacetum coccineum TaxID=301880 RepID=A0ABQ4ZTT9_9ASTR